MTVAGIAPASAQPLSYRSCLAELLVNGESLGSVAFTLSLSGSPLLPPDLVRRALEGRARPAVIAALLAEGQAIDEAALARQHVSLAFDEANLVLSLVIAAEAMLPVNLGPRRDGRTAAGSAPAAAGAASLVPETFAAMLDFDLHGGLGLARDGTSTTGGILPSYSASIDLRPSIYLAGWVAEASADFQAGSTASASPGLSAELFAARLLRDFPSIQARATAGLATLTDSGFGTGLEILGATFGREASMAGDGAWTGPSDEIVLEKPAQVLVELNGVVLRRYSLGKGSWRIADLPLAAGLNDLRIRILEDGAAPRILRTGLPFDPSLLAPGSIDWSLAAGVDRASLGLPFAAGLFSIGVAPGFQLGIRGSYGADLLGAETSARLATILGTLGATGALSLATTPAAPPAWAGRITWNFSVPGSRYLPSLGLGAEYRTAAYLAPSAAVAGREAPTASALTLSGQVSEALPASLGNLALFGGAVFRDGAFSSASASAGLQLLIGRAAIISIAGGADWKAGAGPEPRLSVAFASLPSGGAALQFRQDLVRQDSSFDITVGKDPARAPVFDLRAEGLGAPADPEGSEGPRLGLSLRASRPSVGLGAALEASASADGAFSGASAAFSLSSTLAYAGGQAALGNALGSAFAILVPDPSVEGADIELALASGGRTRTAAGRPVLVPGIAAYRTVSANVELPGSPPDARPLPGAFSFLPAYRSGTVIRIGMAPSVAVVARVITAGGQPLRNLAGRLEAAVQGAAAGAGPAGPSLVFTDEDGILAIYGIEPGSYRVRWTDGSASDFAVAPDARGTVRLGAIQAIAGGSP
jgi:outer membrane usher protein